LRCEPRGIVGTTGGEWVDGLGCAGLEFAFIPLYPSTLSNAVSAFLAIRRLVRRVGVGIIHSHHRFASIVGRSVATVENVPFVSTVHDLAPGNRFLTRLGIGETVTVFSDAVSKHLVDHFGVPGGTIDRLPMGVLDARTDTTDGVTIEPDGQMVAFAGRLSWEKGIHVFLDALPLIRSRVPARVLIIGEGEERERVISTIAERGLTDVVTLTGGVDDVRPLLAQSDLVVIPSLREGFGRVVIEAFAAGTPVVASATGGLTELVSDHVNGILVPPGDAGALAEAVVAILSDHALAKKLKTGARSVDLSRYSVDAMAGAMSRIYERLLQKGHDTRALPQR
jgi:glycogen(starch) synthase